MFRKNYWTQAGRSMIEILAVLGVIAVLTIGGLFGYRYAMSVYHANKILNDVNTLHFVIEENKDKVSGEGRIRERDFIPESDFRFAAFNEPERERYHIDVYHVPKPVCRALVKRAEGNYVYLVNQVLYEGNENICREDNLVSFFYGNTDRVCNLCEDPDEVGCCNGCRCADIQTCMRDERLTLYPRANFADRCCAEDEVNCGGRCVKKNCPNGEVLSPVNCQCDCQDLMKTKTLNKKGEVVCACRPDLNGNELIEKNGNCVCKSGVYSGVPGDGLCCKSESYTYVPSLGRCTELDCSKGNSGYCYLDSKFCGCFCKHTDSARTVNCNCVCRPDLCGDPRDYEYVEIGENKIHKTKNGGYNWGCRIGDRSKYCYGFSHPDGGSLGSFHCFNDSPVIPRQCCTANSAGDCVTGSCDANVCNQFRSDRAIRVGSEMRILRGDNNATYVATDPNANIGGCRFSNGIECWPTNTAATTWTCMSPHNKKNCVVNCDMTTKNCWREGDCCVGAGDDCENAACGAYGWGEAIRTFDSNGNVTSTTNYCCIEHTETGKTICVNGINHYFREIKNGQVYMNLCGWSCSYKHPTKTVTDGNGKSVKVTDYSKITQISCSNGYCQDPGCAPGWKYAETLNNKLGWGCVTECNYGWDIDATGSRMCKKGKDADNVTQIQCAPTWSGYSYTCYETVGNLGGVGNCGGNCVAADKNHNNCQTWWRKSCAPAITQETEDGPETRPACVYGLPIFDTAKNTAKDEKADFYKCWCDGETINVKGTNICCPKGQVYLGKCTVCPAQTEPNPKENRCCFEGEIYNSDTGKCEKEQPEAIN